MTSASKLSTRYLPFLVVGAVLCLLVVLTPSKARPDAELATEGDFSGEGLDGDGSFAGGGSSSSTTPDGTGAGGDSSSGGGAAVVTGNGGGAGGGAGGGSGGGSSAAGGGGAGPAGSQGDLSNCDANGMQNGPVYPTGAACRPVFTGDNGGATMTGVTAEEIRYVWYNPPSNAAIDGILAAAGYARETGPFCDTMVAFEKSAQKYYEMSGRRLVAMDGPGSNAGSGECGGKYKFFQSRCPSTPDAACYRADAKTIAQQLQPAFVLNPRGLAVLHEELASLGIVDIGYLGSRERFQQFAPFLWGTGFGSERLFGLHAEYYCKRLVGDPPIYDGNNPNLRPDKRKIGLIYPDNGDGALQPAVDLWIQTVRGCGDSGAKTYTYQSDPTRAAQQATNTVAQLRSDGITTVGFCCDPVSMVFFLQAMNQSRYEPEHLIMPASSIASDVVGQLTTPLGVGNQWEHAFGLSGYPVNQPDAAAEYRKAYADGGGPGGAAGAPDIETESWGVFKPMMQMIHSGGAQLTPRSIFEGMQNLPPVAPTKRTTGADYAAPDPFTPLRDMAEIWWNPNLRSYFNDQMGAHCYVNGAARYDIGKIPGNRPPPLFGSIGDCARLEEYE